MNINTIMLALLTGMSEQLYGNSVETKTEIINDLMETAEIIAGMPQMKEGYCTDPKKQPVDPFMVPKLSIYIRSLLNRPQFAHSALERVREAWQASDPANKTRLCGLETAKGSELESFSSELNNLIGAVGADALVHEVLESL